MPNDETGPNFIAICQRTLLVGEYESMMNPQLSSHDPWPEPPQLPGPVIMDQRWTDALFLHWRLPESTAAAFMPPGVMPDVYDGSS